MAVSSLNLKILKTKNFMHSWTKIYYNFLVDVKQDSPTPSESAESGYNSNRNSPEEQGIHKVTVRITCESSGDFTGIIKEFPVSKIPKKLELETKNICARGGQEKYLMCFRIGFADVINVVLPNGDLRPFAIFPRMCEFLTREWSNGRVNFEIMKRFWRSSTVPDQAKLHNLFSLVICIYLDKPAVMNLTPSVARPQTRPKTLFESPSSSKSESPESSLGEESAVPSLPRAEKPLDFPPEGPVFWSKEDLQSLKNSYSKVGTTPMSVLLSAFDPILFQERLQSRNGGDRATPLGRSKLRFGYPSFLPMDYSAFQPSPYAMDYLGTVDRNPALNAAIRRRATGRMIEEPPRSESKLFGEWRSPP